MKIRPMLDDLFPWTDKQTDMMKLIVVFRIFANSLNLLETKRDLLYIRNQSVTSSKHSQPHI